MMFGSVSIISLRRHPQLLTNILLFVKIYKQCEHVDTNSSHLSREPDQGWSTGITFMLASFRLSVLFCIVAAGLVSKQNTSRLP